MATYPRTYIPEQISLVKRIEIYGKSESTTFVLSRNGVEIVVTEEILRDFRTRLLDFNF